jgi:hypothetical protein
MPAPVAPSPLPVEARRSLLPAAHFDGNLVDARRQRSPRTTTTTTITPSVAVFLLLHRVHARRLLLPLLVVRARRRPGLNPYFALPVPTAERRRAASSRHRATIADATMIPAVTILGRRDGRWRHGRHGRAPQLPPRNRPRVAVSVVGSVVVSVVVSVVINDTA